ncbi:MAG: hypothetical protein LBQ00_04390 [Syntrophobacterales bacterium]|jgi:hypothetical protein|nr:hypothetical protein [Syntrophobacterales bacterium]
MEYLFEDNDCTTVISVFSETNNLEATILGHESEAEAIARFLVRLGVKAKVLFS